jgi:Raf kinase inhibitor-like YbhB/YbcL family protein
VFNIPPDISEIEEDSVPRGVQGLNSAGRSEYTGPCPPDGEHRYFFKIFALDTEIQFEDAPTSDEIMEAMESHVLDQAELIGRYGR